MDETTNPEAPEVEDVLVEDEDQDEAATETEEADSPEGEPEEAAEDSDGEEVEYGGKKYKVPTELKDALLRQDDYTRKTQALAEQRKEVEATIQRLNEVNQAEVQAIARLGMIEGRLAEYNDVDWDAWDQSDPASANKARWELMQLQQARGDAVGDIQNARNQAQFAAQQEAAKRLEQGQRVLHERIPGWGQEKAVTLLTEGSKAYDFSAEELQGIDDPRMIMVLNDALEYRRQKQAAATVKKVERQQAIVPAAKVKGAPTAIKGLDDRLSTEEWVRRRNAQLAKR